MPYALDRAVVTYFVPCEAPQSRHEPNGGKAI